MANDTESGVASYYFNSRDIAASARRRPLESGIVASNEGIISPNPGETPHFGGSH
jgi:hypothetical protein